jgi:AP-4 complex subunit epsilon-1
MGSVLNVIEGMGKEDPVKFKDLIPSLVSILKQIGEHRLPSDFDYHRVPAPWMQIRLVRILSLLGQGDAASSSGMYEILFETMKKADVGINAGYAIVYECIKCITKIYPNTKLLDAAADAISRFIDSRSNNLKYLGVTGLAMIVETHPQYAAQHQMSVMDCLEDPDETLQRKTLDLLYRMTNPVNVEFITDKLLDFLRGTTDVFLKQQLTIRVCSVAERYAPSNAWYIKTITQLFEVSGDMVKPQVAQNLMSLIAEGTSESDEADMLLRQTAIELYIELLQNKPPAKLPKILLETMAWCLGEYAYLSSAMSLEDILTRLCLWNTATLQPSTRKFLTSAIFKLVSQAGTCPKQAAEVIDQYTRSKDVDLQQRCLEFQALLTTAPQYLGEIFPVDASAEDVEIDINLRFLDGFCQQALVNGARAYEKPEDDEDEDEDYGATAAASSAFKMTPYAKPETNINRSAMLARGMGTGGQPSGVSMPPGNINANQAVVSTSVDVVGDGLILNTRGVANVWGKKPEAPPPPPVAAALSAPTPSAFESASSFGGSSGGTFGSSNYGAGPYGSSSYGAGTFGQSPAPPPAPAKTPEQLEKERMAAALFGGIVTGAPPPAPAPPVPAAVLGQQSVGPLVAPTPVAAVHLPATEVDLLDLGSFDYAGATPASALADDIFGSTTLDAIPATIVSAPAAAPPVVETVSDDDDAGPVQQAPVDPFVAEGLLGEFSEPPLQGFGVSSSKYEYNGSVMAPMKIVTAQFGQQWGSCPATSPVSLTSRKVTSLDAFMRQCESAGLHPVEAIGATNEGISAGSIEGGSKIVLIHGKIFPLGLGEAKLDITVKSTDSTLSGSLALYLQNMMK